MSLTTSHKSNFDMRRAARQSFTDAVRTGDLVDWTSAYYQYDRLWIYLGKRNDHVIMVRFVQPIVRELEIEIVNRTCMIVRKGEQ